MTQDSDMWSAAEAEVTRRAADSDLTEEDLEASDDSLTAEGTESSGAEAASTDEGRDTLDFTDPAAVAQYIVTHPDEGPEVLRDMKRHQDGARGTEISKIQNLERTLYAIQQQLNQNSQPATQGLDEYGLSAEDVQKLDKIISSLPTVRTLANTGQTISQNSQLESLWNGVRAQYGDTFTPERQRRAERIIRKAGYNLNDPDVVAECQEITQEMEREARGKRTERVQGEQHRRTTTQRRVAASSESGITSGTALGDIKVSDKKGNVTVDAMLDAAEKYARMLDRRTR